MLNISLRSKNALKTILPLDILKPIDLSLEISKLLMHL